MCEGDKVEQARRIKRGWMNLRVEKIIDETWDTKTFVLVDADEGGRPFDCALWFLRRSRCPVYLQ